MLEITKVGQSYTLRLLKAKVEKEETIKNLVKAELNFSKDVLGKKSTSNSKKKIKKILAENVDGIDEETINTVIDVLRSSIKAGSVVYENKKSGISVKINDGTENPYTEDVNLHCQLVDDYASVNWMNRINIEGNNKSNEVEAEAEVKETVEVTNDTEVKENVEVINNVEIVEDATIINDSKIINDAKIINSCEAEETTESKDDGDTEEAENKPRYIDDAKMLHDYFIKIINEIKDIKEFDFIKMLEYNPITLIKDNLVNISKLKNVLTEVQNKNISSESKIVYRTFSTLLTSVVLIVEAESVALFNDVFEAIAASISLMMAKLEPEFNDAKNAKDKEYFLKIIKVVLLSISVPNGDTILWNELGLKTTSDNKWKETIDGFAALPVELLVGFLEIYDNEILSFISNGSVGTVKSTELVKCVIDKPAACTTTTLRSIRENRIKFSNSSIGFHAIRSMF